MEKPILELVDFKKSFRSYWTFLPTEAVRGVSLKVYKGESFGFLGHNGAGKTTTIKCILGLIHKTGGKILIDGEELSSSEQKSKLGYLPEQPYFYEHLSVGETLDFFASLHGISKQERKKIVPETLEIVNLQDRYKSPVRSLSKGLQQRLGFAQAIINKPELLFLDEPFSGLDPLGRLEIRNLILDLNRKGTTIFLSSHILSDVEDICSRVSIMADGELKRVFSLSETADIFGRSYELVIELPSSSQNLHDMLSAKATEHEVQDNLNNKQASYTFPNYDTATAALQSALEQRVKVVSFQSTSANLEEVFMEITQQSKADKEDSGSHES